MQTYLEPTQGAARALWMGGIPGEIDMLNLLRLREVADYAANPELAPERPISGAAAYDRYIAHTLLSGRERRRERCCSWGTADLS